MQLIKKYPITLIGVAIGMLAGFAWYYFVGCESGTCPITSKPLNSTLYGGVMGGLAGDIFNDRFSGKAKNEKPGNGLMEN